MEIYPDNPCLRTSDPSTDATPSEVPAPAPARVSAGPGATPSGPRAMRRDRHRHSRGCRELHAMAEHGCSTDLVRRWRAALRNSAGMKVPLKYPLPRPRMHGYQHQFNGLRGTGGRLEEQLLRACNHSLSLSDVHGCGGWNDCLGSQAQCDRPGAACPARGGLYGLNSSAKCKPRAVSDLLRG